MRMTNPGAQYGDLRGVCNLDFFHSLLELKTFCQGIDIDTNKYDPIGFSIYFGEDNYFNLSIYAINTETTIDNKVLIDTDIDAHTFFKKIKRLGASFMIPRYQDTDGDFKEISIDD